MANQLSVQVVPRHAGWVISGPEASTSVAPQQDLAVTFPDSTSVVVPALVAAQLPGGGTTWDRTQAVVVGYVVPGDPTLRACFESQLAGLSGDYAPLVAVLEDCAVVYQTQQPDGSGAAAGAWSGGAVLTSARSVSGYGSYGALDTQSMSGGGSVSGLVFQIPPGDGTGGHQMTVTSLYLKVPGAPAGDTAIFAWDAGGTGYYRLKLTSALHLILEFSYAGGGSGSLDIAAGAISASTWYWISCDFASGGGGNQVKLQGAVTPGPGAQLSGAIGFPPVQVAFTSTFSLGHSPSGGYADFPNTTGWEISKAVVDQIGSHSVTGNLRGPLTADLGSGAAYAAYMCRQSVGATATLTDTSGNNFNLAGAMTINADGPFA